MSCLTGASSCPALQWLWIGRSGGISTIEFYDHLAQKSINVVDGGYLVMPGEI